jgi:hydrogenase-1 operon protein HyaE
MVNLLGASALPSPLVRALSERHGLPLVDETSIDAFLAQGGCALLLFAGDPKQRMESDDVAVVLPELLKAFAGRYRGAVVARAAEDRLKARFQVVMQPSLVVARGADTLDVITKIRDWAEYVARLSAALAPDAAPLPRSAGLNTQIRIKGVA